MRKLAILFLIIISICNGFGLDTNSFKNLMNIQLNESQKSRERIHNEIKNITTYAGKKVKVFGRLENISTDSSVILILKTSSHYHYWLNIYDGYFGRQNRDKIGKAVIAIGELYYIPTFSNIENNTNYQLWLSNVVLSNWDKVKEEAPSNMIILLDKDNKEEYINISTN